MVSIFFTADYAYAPNAENELGLAIGETVEVLCGVEDWWYGKVGEREGWFPPIYGHLEKPANYVPPTHRRAATTTVVDKRSSMMPGDNRTLKTASSFRYASTKPLSSPLKLTSVVDEQSKFLIVRDFCDAEAEMVRLMQLFVDGFIQKVNVKNTDLKRSILADPNIAVEVNLYEKIHKVIQDMLAKLEVLKSMTDHDAVMSQFAVVMKTFAPSLRSFGQYMSEHANAVDSFQKNASLIGTFLTNYPLPEELSFDQYLCLPLVHYPKYLHFLEQFQQACGPEGFENTFLMEAVDVITSYTQEIDYIMQEEQIRAQLLTLQSKFIGSVDIYRPHRRLIKDGEMEKYDINDIPVALYFHLFNDALIYSRMIGIKFKFSRAINLRIAWLEDVPDMLETKQCFKVLTNDRTWLFRCATARNKADWMDAISTQIKELREETQRNDSNFRIRGARDQTGAASRQAIQAKPAQIGDRATRVCDIITYEDRFVARLAIFYQSMVKPLLDASKGAALRAGSTDVGGTENAIFKQSSSTLVMIGGSIQRAREQAIVSSLQESDLQIFLRAVEDLVEYSAQLVRSIEERIVTAKWSEAVQIGDLFLNAEYLYKTQQSYAASCSAAMRMLKRSALRDFVREAEANLGAITIKECTDGMLNAPSRFLRYLQGVLQVTLAGHPDLPYIEQAITKVQGVCNEQAEVVAVKRNYEKLVEIKENMVFVGLFVDPLVENIVSNERRLVLEADLIKVCRKKNKTFHFWLFDDFLMYGAYLSGSSYQFHRTVHFGSAAVQENRQNNCAFDIMGAEKSFVVICPSPDVRQTWVAAIRAGIVATRKSSGDSAALISAPVWVPDDGASKCAVCYTGFSLTTRKHHCRKCGRVVCNTCSKNRLVLAYIDHKKVRVCDTCMQGGVAGTNASDLLRQGVVNNNAPFALGGTQATANPPSPAVPVAPPVPPKPTALLPPIRPSSPASSPLASAPTWMGGRKSFADDVDAIMPTYAPPPPPQSPASAQPAAPIVVVPPAKPAKPSVRYEQSPVTPATSPPVVDSPATGPRRKPPTMPRPAGTGPAGKRASKTAPPVSQTPPVPPKPANNVPTAPEIPETPASPPPPPPKPVSMRADASAATHLMSSPPAPPPRPRARPVTPPPEPIAPEPPRAYFAPVEPAAAPSPTLPTPAPPAPVAPPAPARPPAPALAAFSPPGPAPPPPRQSSLLATRVSEEGEPDSPVDFTPRLAMLAQLRTKPQLNRVTSIQRTRKVENLASMLERGSIMESIATAMANRRFNIEEEYNSDSDYDSDDSDF